MLIWFGLAGTELESLVPPSNSLLEFFDYAGEPFLTAFVILLLLLFELGEVFLAKVGFGRNDTVSYIILQSVEDDERGVAGHNGVLLPQFGDFILMLVRTQFQLGDFLLGPDPPGKPAVRGMSLAV